MLIDGAIIFFCWEVCEGLTVAMLVVGVGCAKVVVTIPCLVC